MSAVARISEVPNFGKKVVSIDGKEIVLVNVKGTIYAVENECPHQGSPMTGGIVRDGTISCPRHGYRFSLADGSCGDHPDLPLKTYAVTIVGDEIFVEP